METSKLQALLGAGGCGKLQPLTEPVCTPEGFKPMGDIKADSLVIARDGTAAKVLQVYPQTNLEIYKVNFSDDTWCECCIDHLFLIQTKKMVNINKFRVMSLKEMLPNINTFRTGKKGYYYSIPLCDSVEFFYKPIPIPAYTLGYLLGNGCLPISRTVSVTCHANELNEMYKLISDNLPSDVFNMSFGVVDNTNIGSFLISTEIKKYLNDLNLLGKLSFDKFLPEIFKYNTSYNRLELLKGLMDSDGSISVIDGVRKKLRFSSSSKQLAEDVMFLVRSLGGLTTLIISDRKDKKYLEYSVVIRMPENPFKLERKAKLFDAVPQHFHFNKKIVSAEYIGQKDGQCIVVNHPSHTYLTRDFIVTHNSYAINQRLKEDSKFCFRTATSGVAAINMTTTIGGNTATTINSALGYFNDSTLLYKVIYQEALINQNIARIANNYKYLVIDEISLQPSAQLDLIHYAVNRYNNKFGTDLGIIVVGDPGQLPAVSGEPFFTAKCWDKFNVTYLTEVKRQKDKDFINALSLVRQGKAAECIDWFIDNVEFSKQIDWDFQGSTFFSTNREVDEYNHKSLAKIPTKHKRYRAVILGTPHPTWKDIPQYVELKQGALIQILVNNLEAGYANGDMGFVEEMYDSKLTIRLLRTGRVIYLEYVVNKNTLPGSYKSIGSIRRMPVRLAYSISIHKSQSLSLDAAQVSLRSNNFLSTLSGGLYTALSRVRTKQGLRIVGSKDDFINTCFIDERYKQWIK